MKDGLFCPRRGAEIGRAGKCQGAHNLRARPDRHDKKPHRGETSQHAGYFFFIAVPELVPGGLRHEHGPSAFQHRTDMARETEAPPAQKRSRKDHVGGGILIGARHDLELGRLVPEPDHSRGTERLGEAVSCEPRQLAEGSLARGFSVRGRQRHRQGIEDADERVVVRVGLERRRGRPLLVRHLATSSRIQRRRQRLPSKHRQLVVSAGRAAAHNIRAHPTSFDGRAERSRGDRGRREKGG